MSIFLTVFFEQIATIAFMALVREVRYFLYHKLFVKSP